MGAEVTKYTEDPDEMQALEAGILLPNGYGAAVLERTTREFGK